MWFGRGSAVAQTWFGRGSDVGRMWFGRVSGSGADSLAEVKGKWFPARGVSPCQDFVLNYPELIFISTQRRQCFRDTASAFRGAPPPAELPAFRLTKKTQSKKTIWAKNPFLRQVLGCSRSMRSPSCELWRSLAKFGELWRAHNAFFTRTSLTFTRVPAKVPHIHQSSGEGAVCMWVAFRMCPIFGQI